LHNSSALESLLLFDDPLAVRALSFGSKIPSDDGKPDAASLSGSEKEEQGL
jgi:hypothetical protein